MPPFSTSLILIEISEILGEKSTFGEAGRNQTNHFGSEVL